MKFNTLKFALLAALALLLLAGVLSLIVEPANPLSDGAAGDQIVTDAPTGNAGTPTPDGGGTNAPVTPLLTLTPRPVTATPAPTAKPTPTAAPTPAPTPTPVPTPAVRNLGSGSFRSETGVPINLVCSWSAQTSGSGTAEITVHAALESYALHVNSSANALRFTVNGSSAAANMPAINTDTTELLLTDLGSMRFTVNIADGSTVTVPVSVDWMFGGVYSGVELDVVTASTSITLSR